MVKDLPQGETQYETDREAILALAGWPTAWVHRNAQGKLLIAETKPSWDETVWPPVFTADQLIAARKPLVDEIAQMKKERDLAAAEFCAVFDDRERLRQQLADITR